MTRKETIGHWSSIDLVHLLGGNGIEIQFPFFCAIAQHLRENKLCNCRGPFTLFVGFDELQMYWIFSIVANKGFFDIKIRILETEDFKLKYNAIDALRNILITKSKLRQMSFKHHLLHGNPATSKIMLHSNSGL